MSRIRITRWSVGSLVWITGILLSSTQTAGQWGDQSFSSLSKLLFHSWRPTRFIHHLLYLSAEKGFHIGMFVVLALLLWQALPPARWKVISILSVGLVVGSCSELLQIFFPDRDPAIRDVFINVAATALGVTLRLMLDKLKLRARRSFWEVSAG